MRAAGEERVATIGSYLGVGSLLPVSVDAELPDFRFQRLAWNSEFHGCTGQPRYSPMALSKSSFDHLYFTFR